MQIIELGLIVAGGIGAFVVLVLINISHQRRMRDASAKERADLDRDMQQW